MALLHAALGPVALQLVVESDPVVLVVACDLVVLVVEWTLVMVLLTHHHLLLQRKQKNTVHWIMN